MYRDGTSKPIFFLENDLPKDVKKREQVVLEAFGTPDVRQIDGWVEPTH
jgi:2-methylaconitate cis-trans-isomerase PrpF